MKCLHCKNKKPCRPRGLCWGCYYTPGLRDLYPIDSTSNNNRGIKDFNGKAPLPKPTNAIPRTDEKIAVLERRAELGQSLWNPNDAKADCR